ncbi:MAG: DNA recombination/repair protein RecA, partial [Patescibacteria group bacterium]|nr:DNA recombination/repair protein RecA [Patescibacteria group bacterium]
TPAVGEWDKTFDPTSAMALQARSLSYGFRRIINLLGKTQSTLLILNQLKTNIGPTAMAEPFVTPCGKAIQYNAHLRLFLVSRKAKAHNIYLNGEKIGSDLLVKIRKSRFGTEERYCELKIIWGDGIRVCDEESWVHALKSSPYFEKKRGSYVVYMDEEKVSSVSIPHSDWVLRMQNDMDTRERVRKLLYDELVEKYANKKRTDIALLESDDDDSAMEEEFEEEYNDSDG